MNAVEHFEAAERQLAVATEHEYGSDEERYALARAQVHATLAVAATGLRSLPATQDTTD